MRSVSRRRRRLLSLCIVGALGLAAVVVVEGSVSADAARNQYVIQQQVLAADLHSARAEGYGVDELQPILAAKAGLETAPEPVWVGDRTGFYRHQAVQESQLHEQLTQVRVQLLDQSRLAATTQLQGASAKIAEDAKLGAEGADLKTLRSELDQADKKLQAARTLAEFRASAKQLEAVAGKASEIEVAQKAELAAIQQAADQLSGQPLDSILKSGRAALGTGRDEAVAATWLRVSGFDRSYRLLEKYAPLLGSTEKVQVATASAALHRYEEQIHQALVKGMPSKAILISMASQSLTAYQAGKPVQETYVTTGRPPDLATDVGPMKVLWKQSPWKMHSPWPKESPYYYPDTMVQRVVWFTNTGEGLHDASWQPDGTYGPGSQYGPSASHGCVHVPPPSEIFLFNWVETGTPVVIIPGDGQPLAAQLAQKTTDDDGNPFTGPKGA